MCATGTVIPTDEPKGIAPLFPELIPYFIELQDDRSSRGLWLLMIVLGHVPAPGEYSLSGDVEEKRAAEYGHTTQVCQRHIIVS